MAGEEKLTIKSEVKGFGDTAKQIDQVTDAQAKLKEAVGKTAEPTKDVADAQKSLNASEAEFIALLSRASPALGGYADAGLKAIKIAGSLADKQIDVIGLVKQATEAIKTNSSALKLFGAGGALVGGVVALAAAFRAIKEEAAAARKEIEGVIKAQTALKGEQADTKAEIEKRRDQSRSGPFSDAQARAASETVGDIAGKRQFGFLDKESVIQAVVAVGGRSDQAGGGSRNIDQIARIAALIQQNDLQLDPNRREDSTNRQIDRALRRFSEKLDKVFGRESEQVGAATRQAAAETRAVGGSIAGLKAVATRRTAGTFVQDGRSRAVVGWHLSESSNTDTIVPAYLMAFRDWAIPGVLRIDNGKDFTSERLTGFTKATRILTLHSNGCWVVQNERWDCVAASWPCVVRSRSWGGRSKKTLRADEQDRPDVVRRRMNFAIARRFADLDQFVFLDESSAKTNMTRLYGRAPVGQRCYFSASHGHWRTTTLLSAIRCTGVIEDASIVFDGPTDTIVFRGYVERNSSATCSESRW